MKFEKDIGDNVRQAALFAMAPEAVVENRLAGRRDNSAACYRSGTREGRVEPSAGSRPFEA